MKMLLSVEFPPEPFNNLVKKGKVDEIMERILATIQPEVIYFTEQNGKRGCILVVDVLNPSAIPSLSEPFFLNFDSTCEFRILMSPEDLKNAGLKELGKKWG